MDELLKSFGLGYEDLDTPGHSGEREQLMLMLQNVENSEITVDKMKDHILAMRSTLEKELVTTPETERVWLFFERPNRRAVILKAQLATYMQLESYLGTPEQAKAAIEEQLRNLKAKVNY